MLQKILFRKIEVWIVLLVLIFGGIIAVLYGTVVYRYPRKAVIGEIAVNIARFPLLVKDLFWQRNNHIVEDRFPQMKSGFSFYDPSYLAQASQYLLLNRFDEDWGYNVTEFYREGSKNLLKSWVFNDPTMYKYDRVDPVIQNKITHDPATMRATHSILDREGNLTVHFQDSPVYQLSSCQKLKWMNQDFAYHHSIERDAEGNFWVPGTQIGEKEIEGYDEQFRSDNIVQISPQGKVLYSKPVMEILKENDLANRIHTYDQYIEDPLHLNDIQPVTKSGDYWKVGDVFFSLGHLNMILLYRPGTSELIWWSQSLMKHQHDIDILDLERIGVFDNNRETRADGNVVHGHNEILVFDFKRNTIESPWVEPFREYDIRTISQGLFDIGHDGSVLVEETNYGRLIKMDSAGKKQWEYLNRAGSGTVYSLNWSRYIPQTLGDAVSVRLSKQNCEHQR